MCWVYFNTPQNNNTTQENAKSNEELSTVAKPSSHMPTELGNPPSLGIVCPKPYTVLTQDCKTKVNENDVNVDVTGSEEACTLNSNAPKFKISSDIFSITEKSYNGSRNSSRWRRILVVWTTRNKQWSLRMFYSDIYIRFSWLSSRMLYIPERTRVIIVRQILVWLIF